MTISCPCRHSSYSKWPRQSFHWLLAASGAASPAPTFLLQSRLAGSRRRQAISTSFRNALARDRETHSSLLRSDRRAAQEVGLERRQASTRQADGTQKAPSQSKHGLALEPDLVSDGDERNATHWQPSLNCQGSEDTAGGDGLATQNGEVQKTRLLGRRCKQKQWSPYEGRGSHDLRALAASLQESLESFDRPTEDQTEVTSQAKPSELLPVSPLVPALERQKTPKVSLKGTGKEELADNPWANMLASPMRLCAATGVRLPRDLLVPWGLVRNPATEEVYLMPTELAELHSLRDKRKPPKLSRSALLKTSLGGEGHVPALTLDSSASQVTEDVHSDSSESSGDLSLGQGADKHSGTYTGLGGSHIPSPASKSSSLRRSPFRIYMLPFLLLLDHLTLRFTTLQRDLVTRRSKPNALNSILPYRVKSSIDRAKFYAEQGAKKSRFANPGEATKTPFRSRFQDVKWDVNIKDVMLRILRARLLAALEMLANQDQKMWRQERERVKAIRAVRLSRGNTKGKGWTLPGGRDADQPVAGQGERSDFNGAGICLLIEPNGANSTTSEEEIDPQTKPVDHDDITLISCSASSQSLDSCAAGRDSRCDNTSLEPSILQVGQHRWLPLFSLNDLFDTDHMSRFRDLSANLGVLALRRSIPHDSQGDAYILIVPVNAPGASSVVEETWRLWRFLGGSRA